MSNPNRGFTVCGRMLGLAFLLLLSLGSSAVRADEASWRAFVDESRAILDADQKALVDDYGVTDYERFDVDQDQGELVFSNGGVVHVRARIVFVGSLSHTSQTWLWSWANTSVLAHLTEPMKAVQAVGRARGFEKLVEPKWDAVEADAWDMAAIANHVLNGKGVYRAPYSTGLALLVLTEVRRVHP